MLGHLLDRGVRNGSDVSACQCTVGNVDGVTNACCDDLGLDACYCEDVSDLADQVNASGADVIQTAKERRYIGSACSCIYIPIGGVLVAKSCLTLATPWTVDCQAPLSMRFSKQEY